MEHRSGADGAGLRFCRRCGTVLVGKQQKYCAECAEKEGHGRSAPGELRFCLICGIDLGVSRAKYCRQCRGLYTTAAARKLAAAGRAPTPEELEQDAWLLEAKRRAQRRCRISGDRIAQLAQLYDRPYNSYGKLRAYIEEFDRLPDERFLIRNRKYPVIDWQADPRDRD